MLERYFRLTEHSTTIRTELMAGLITFLTMSYIIFVQPAVLSGRLFGMDTGIDFGAVTTATCLSAAIATAIMAIFARYPIAQAPGMGENFFFVFSIIPGAAAAGFANAWEVALGVVFISGILFLLLSLVGVRGLLLDAISPTMRNAIAVGIGIFIAFIGLQNAGVIVSSPATAVKLNTHLAFPDLIVFFFGLLITAVLHVRRVYGSILWGIVSATALAIGLRFFIFPHFPEIVANSTLVRESALMTRFTFTDHVFAMPPSLAPTFLRMDIKGALSLVMLPFIIILLFMDIFDTTGTLVGVSEQAGFIKDNKLPRANRVFLSDAVGTVTGAHLGTSTVTSFIESAAGVEQGGRTGLTGLTTAVLFLAALFFSPVIAMVGSYAPITAPALVVVGAMMIKNVSKMNWLDYSESVPAFLTIIGIPLTYSIADGLALGFISYPLIKLLSGKGKEVKGFMYMLAIILVAYFIFLRSAMN